MIAVKSETKNTLFYQYQVEVFDFTFIVNIQYNSRLGKRVIDVKLENGEVLLQPTVLTPYNLLFCTRADSLLGYEVLVWLEKLDDSKGDDFLNWSNNCVVCIGVRDRE